MNAVMTSHVPRSSSAPAVRRTARRLSAVIVPLMAGTALWGVLTPALYRDNAFVASGWFGNDLTTLLVATPLLVIAHAAAGRSARAELVWMGLLDYVLYNYAFYLFGAAFNPFFLAYAALFTLAMFALVFALVDIDVHVIARALDPRVPARIVSVFLIVVVVIGLGGFHVTMAVIATWSGEPPAIVSTVGHPTNVIAALDLSLVVSVSALAAVWLWRGNPWGYVLAVVTTVKGALYMLALSAATLSAYDAGASGDVSALALWISIGVGCLLAAWALLRHLPAGSSRGGVT